MGSVLGQRTAMAIYCGPNGGGAETFRILYPACDHEWSDHAPVLILLISYTLNANGTPSGSHAFDAGTAWGTIATGSIARPEHPRHWRL